MIESMMDSFLEWSSRAAANGIGCLSVLHCLEEAVEGAALQHFGLHE